MIPDDGQPQPLDDHYVLEPVDSPADLPLLGGDPIVSDVRGRMWRVRRRSAFGSVMGVPLLAVVGLLLAVLVLLAIVL